ncbi:LysR family transcriptional regulator [Rhizobium rhizosphaerae]|uniref:LysR family transcriptional regulator n=1 Tax=Xaviernesmea rhizosphaerae TaxID=1672749 RepID=A0A1Q9AP26_9HYPH|nr:LysR family transcriptional regulator [Xaviernesmea rhizosphaerae]OLP57166.1 LysR family transcriptional regulator [Xaviernesmea rhizosphaerae]
MNPMEPSWDHYRTFLHVLREGSLSAAARTLGLTQPTVGRHIDALEAAAGAPLFLRSATGLTPTDAALTLAPFAEEIAASAAAFLRTAASARGPMAGRVRISASEVMAIEVIPAILAQLAEQHPQLVLELSVSDMVEDLLRHEADVAVRMVAPQQEALVSRALGTLEVGLFAHHRYIARHGLPQTEADLADHRVIGFDRNSAFLQAVRRRVPILDQLSFALRTDSNLAQLSAVRAGFGIGACQVRLAERDPDLRRVLGEHFSFPLPTYLVMHENLRTVPRCRAVFDALAEGLSVYIAGRTAGAREGLEAGR